VILLKQGFMMFQSQVIHSVVMRRHLEGSPRSNDGDLASPLDSLTETLLQPLEPGSVNLFGISTKSEKAKEYICCDNLRPAIERGRRQGIEQDPVSPIRRMYVRPGIDMPLRAHISRKGNNVER
jgi:hypothetical protein